jgi:hypothetical protein
LFLEAYVSSAKEDRALLLHLLDNILKETDYQIAILNKTHKLLLEEISVFRGDFKTDPAVNLPPLLGCFNSMALSLPNDEKMDFFVEKGAIKVLSGILFRTTL